MGACALAVVGLQAIGAALACGTDISAPARTNTDTAIALTFFILFFPIPTQ
jgi:hypothetical protein